MSDSVDRQAAIGTLDDEITITGISNAYVVKDYVQRVKRKLENLPPAQSELEDKIRAIGCTGKEGRIYIGGRLFAIRELPQ